MTHGPSIGRGGGDVVAGRMGGLDIGPCPPDPTGCYARVHFAEVGMMPGIPRREPRWLSPALSRRGSATVRWR